MFFGLGSMISSILMGYLIDFTNSRKAIVFNVLCLVATLVISFINFQNYKDGKAKYKLAIGLSFTWGFSDGVIQTHCF